MSLSLLKQAATPNAPAPARGGMRYSGCRVSIGGISSVTARYEMADIIWLVGKTCDRVWEHYPHNFSFKFDDGVLGVDCLWRIVGEGRLIRTSGDHGHQYGLPAPVDAYAEAESILRGRPVASTRIREET